jgi:hypothetical protein
MRRKCFGPGPCWGNRQIQCFQLLKTSTQPVQRHLPDTPRRNLEDRVLGAADDARVFRIQTDAKSPDVATGTSEHAVAEVDTKEIRIGATQAAVIDASHWVGWRRAASDVEVGQIWYGGWDSNPQALTGSRV